MTGRFVVEARERGTSRGAWVFDVEVVAPHRDYLLKLTSDDRRVWTSRSSDVFSCLLKLREELEPQDIAVACNGSRLDAWASGMQRDMGQGLAVYLLADAPDAERPPQVATLGPTDWDTVATLTEQRSWYEAWLGRRGG